MPQPSVANGSDRYRLTRKIGVGAMAEVWRGHDERLDRPVAVKMLHPPLSRDPDARERFHREACLAGALTHPGVVATYDYLSSGAIHLPPCDGTIQPDRPCLVMELVEAPALSQHLANRGRLGVSSSLRILWRVAEALQAAHERGIVHRDIKPANILVGGPTLIKVTDFGIAAAVGVCGLTRTGTILGTAGYLSPERIQGQSATPASDLYALGVLGYACLTGAPPFTTGSDLTIARAHVEEPPAPLPHRVPLRVRELVYALLEKQPADRPSSAAEVVTAVQAIQQQEPAPTPRRRRPQPCRRRDNPLPTAWRGRHRKAEAVA
jgi:serine/threonine-protein kinase